MCRTLVRRRKGGGWGSYKAAQSTGGGPARLDRSRCRLVGTDARLSQFMAMCRPGHAPSQSVGYPHRTLQNGHQRRFSTRSARRLTSCSAATIGHLTRCHRTPANGSEPVVGLNRNAWRLWTGIRSHPADASAAPVGHRQCRRAPTNSRGQRALPTSGRCSILQVLRVRLFWSHRRGPDMLHHDLGRFVAGVCVL